MPVHPFISYGEFYARASEIIERRCCVRLAQLRHFVRGLMRGYLLLSHVYTRYLRASSFHCRLKCRSVSAGWPGCGTTSWSYAAEGWSEIWSPLYNTKYNDASMRNITSGPEGWRADGVILRLINHVGSMMTGVLSVDFTFSTLFVTLTTAAEHFTYISISLSGSTFNYPGIAVPMKLSDNTWHCAMKSHDTIAVIS